jgi:hypothetical protein
VAEFCGDGEVNQVKEDCYTPDLLSLDCLVFGYDGGVLGCGLGTCLWDFSQCAYAVPEICDNGKDDDFDTDIDADDPDCASQVVAQVGIECSTGCDIYIQTAATTMGPISKGAGYSGMLAITGTDRYAYVWVRQTDLQLTSAQTMGIWVAAPDQPTLPAVSSDIEATFYQHTGLTLGSTFFVLPGAPELPTLP